MKKLRLIIVVIGCVLAPSLVKAVSYRGFVDGSFGISKTSELEPVFTIEGYTTHGVQLSKNFFVGLGVMYRYSTEYTYEINNGTEFWNDMSHYIRPYLSIRWDGFGLFKNSSRVSPFVDFKIGYSFGINFEDNIRIYGNYSAGGYEYSYNYWNNNVEIGYDVNSWFFRPTIGIRIGCSSKVGINVGLFCDISRLVKIKEANLLLTGRRYDSDIGEYIEYHNIPFQVKSQSGMWFPVGLAVGVDF